MSNVALAVALIASWILGVVHFFDLFSEYVFYRQPDPVFPFVSGRVSYALFTVLLLAYGTVSLGAFSDDHRALKHWALRLSLLVMVSIAFYRGALWTLGVPDCRCLGALGHALDLSKAAEKNLRWAFFFCLASPLAVVAFPIGRWILKRVSFQRAVSWGANCLLLLQLSAENSLQIEGKIQSITQHPDTGAGYTNESSSGSFNVQIGTQGYRIKVADEKSRSFIELLNDNRSLTLLQYLPKAENKDGDSDDFVAYAVVDSGHWFLGAGENRLHPYAIWLAFGLQKRGFEETPINSRPLPWGQPRYSLEPYGYSWSSQWAAGDLFPSGLTATRDRSLDAKTEREAYLRPQLDFPSDLITRRRYKVQFEEIIPQVPSGILAGRYSAQGWEQTGNFRAPTTGSLEWFLHDGITAKGTNHAHPLVRSTFQVHRRRLSDQGIQFKLEVPRGEEIRVRDFRFRKQEGERLFQSAEYAVKSGAWIRADNDAELLSSRETYLKTGPKMSWSMVTPAHELLWSLFLTTLTLLGWWTLRRGKTTQARYNEEQQTQSIGVVGMHRG